MNEEDNKQTSFVEHLTELRSRLVKSIIYLFIFFVVCYFFAENIYNFFNLLKISFIPHQF